MTHHNVETLFSPEHFVISKQAPFVLTEQIHTHNELPGVTFSVLVHVAELP